MKQSEYRTATDPQKVQHHREWIKKCDRVILSLERCLASYKWSRQFHQEMADKIEQYLEDLD
jgi:hypothetical protein